MEWVKIKILREGVDKPQYQTKGASGFDLQSTEDRVIYPGGVVKIPTGLAFEVPRGYELQVRSRSGTTLKKGLVVPNSPGTVDSDYRGEVSLILHNIGGEPVLVRKGERVAQGVICPVVCPVLQVVTQLTETKRGDNGFGSTGE